MAHRAVRRAAGKFQHRHRKARCRAGALLFHQWGRRQVQLEGLVLEDAAGGRVPVRHAEQPVLFTMGAGQFCQESELQDKTQTASTEAPEALV